ncbi:MAG: rod shape-determining protein MreC [Alphaproteobacteria bacterium]|nr:rod shape-determining protein MreC [Alphaproteobacteria bacterium]
MARANFKRQGWKTPIELRAHRGGLIAFGSLATILLLVGRAELPLIDDVRMVAADASRAVLQAGSDAAGWASDGIETVSHAATLYGDNARLRAENEELLAWRAKAMEYERRIAAFESILEISYTPIAGVTTASVIADTAGPFSRAIIVNAGAQQGVRKGDAALDRFGLVGRVIAVGQASSRVLLLTDTTSHVPVLIEPAGVRAILSGDADGQALIQFVPGGVTLAEGAAIVTSGDGGVLPPGLPVGVVRARADGSAVAALYADIARVEVVALKRYEVINDVDVPPLPMPDLPLPAALPETPVASNPAPAGE